MANEWTKYVFCVQLYFNIIKWVHCPMRLLLWKCHSRSSLVCVGVKLSWYIYYCEWWWWDVLSIFCSTGNHGNYFSVSVIWTYFRHNETRSIVLAALYVRIWKLEYPLLSFSGWCQNKRQLLRFMCLQTHFFHTVIPFAFIKFTKLNFVLFVRGIKGW